jgi:drug/metabolite transporter (DMT)-like permease
MTDKLFKPDKRKGFIYVLLSGLGFGFIGVFSRLAFQSGLSVGELLFWRFLMASVLLGTGLFIFRRQWLKLSQKQILISMALGCLGYAVFSSFYLNSIQGLSIPLAVLLLFTFPLFVNIGSFLFLKEKLSKQQIGSLFLASLGLLILLWGPMFVESTIAVVYGLGAAMTYAVYVLVSGKVQKNVNPLSSSFYVISSAAMTLFLFHRPDISGILNFSLVQLLSVFGLAIICTIGPLTLFLAGMQHIPSSQASVIVMIEPVVATILAWIFFSETLSFSQMIGAFIVLIAMFLNSKG